MAGGPSLTIVIPTYNRAPRLPRVLDSVLAQTRTDFTVLISDNASADGTPEVCAEYAARDSRIRVHRQPENRGPIGNFNWLLSQVETPYLLMLADDDWLEPDYVEKCMERIEADDTLAVVSAVTRYFNEGQIDEPDPDLILNPEMTDARGERRVTTYLSKSWTSSAFYGVMRTEWMRRAIPIPNVMGADWLFLSAMAFQGRIVTTTATRLNRERGGSSATFQDIARTAGLSKWAGVFPITSIIYNQAKDIAFDSVAFETLSRPRRLRLAVAAAWAITREHGLHVLWEPFAPIAMRKPLVYLFGPLYEWYRSSRFYG